MKKLLCLLLSLLFIISSIGMFSACNGVDFDGSGDGGNTDISGDNGDDTPDDGNGGNENPDDGGNDTPSNPDDGGNGGNGGNDTPSNPDDGGAGDTPSNEFIETVVDGVTYTPNQSETYTVSAVNLSSTTLTIPETVNGVAVTEIGKDAVRGKSTLLKVVLPDSVKTLGENSFMGCKKLKDINLSKVEVVGKNAFNGAITTTNTNL
ncbi:MAG: leucine-rich repeat protein, partial [Clostridia bacterium]|nr:leucine-rich repeat protein [Clostridia bacterium]